MTIPARSSPCHVEEMWPFQRSCRTVEEYARAFQVAGEYWQRFDSDRAMVQLGLPSETSVVLWVVPRRGERRRCVVISPSPAAHPITEESLDDSGPARIEIGGLKPGATYEVVIELEEGASRVRRSVMTTTAPARDSAAPFSFLHTSCFQPFVDDGSGSAVTVQTANVLDLFLRRASSSLPPSFALALGDQVYVDDGNRSLLSGLRSQYPSYEREELEACFDKLYRATFSVSPLERALSQLPSGMMWDDHEIRDGWGSQGDEEADSGDRWRDHLAAARKYFAAWQALRNPHPQQAARRASSWEERVKPGARLTSSPEWDYELHWGAGATFFVMDSRSHRGDSVASPLSEEQLQRLEAWLTQPRTEPTVFVLGSPIPLTQVASAYDRLQALAPFRRDDLRDSWWSRRCRVQRARLLGLFADFFGSHSRHRLLIVSGDVHFSEVLELADRNGRVFGHEVVSSGFAHGSFHPLGRRHSQGRERLDARITSRGLGRFLGPSFAELFVTPEPRRCRVEVTFHVAVTMDGKAIANRGSGSMPRFELPLEPISQALVERGGFFRQFVNRPETDLVPTAPASSFY